MPALNGFNIIRPAAAMCLDRADELAEQASKNLETGASTTDVNALRIARAANALIAIGAFQSFEAYLQQTRGWSEAFVSLDTTLRANGENAIADQFTLYKDAINALKHGEGRSYRRLLKAIGLPFRVKGDGDPYLDEGDVSEIIQLIDADSNFVRACLDVMDSAFEKLDAIEARHS